MNFKIFVSYSTKDITQVELLRRQLKNTPIEVFIAEHSITPSQELAPVIAKAITECDLFVLVWSKSAKESDWVSQEIGKATALNKAILPLVLTDGITLPGFIQGLKYLAVHSDPDQALIEARNIITSAYNKKVASIQAAQKGSKDALALMGVGAFLLWVFSK